MNSMQIGRLFFVLILVTPSVVCGVEKVFKHDQFSEDAATAKFQVDGASLATHPGFAGGEAFGQIFRPEVAHYPVKITGFDLILAAPPIDPTATEKATIEVWFTDQDGPNPGTDEPAYSIQTSEFFNPGTGQDNFPLQGGVIYSVEFDWEDPDGHPPILYEGNFIVMIRFDEAGEDLGIDWGVGLACSMSLGCGCQSVAPYTDSASVPNANIINIVSECGGPAATWMFADKVGVQGDFILHVQADVTDVGCSPVCGAKECGSDGCGGDCGQCASDETCQSGQCVTSSSGCTPACDGKSCGSDGCNGVCGVCGDGTVCQQGSCVATGCTSDCAGKSCGDDGCGGVCGVCGEGTACDAGTCVASSCVPECSGLSCGDDGCGGSCGSCEGGQSCQSGSCISDSTPTGELSISGISPAFGYADEQTSVSILGAGFRDDASVKLGGTDLIAVSVAGDGLIEATVPKGMTPGLYALIVVNPDGATESIPNAYEVRERDDSSAGPPAASCSVTARSGLNAGWLAWAFLLMLYGVRRHGMRSTPR
jgi:hypothetical protein